MALAWTLNLAGRPYQVYDIQEMGEIPDGAGNYAFSREKNGRHEVLHAGESEHLQHAVREQWSAPGPLRDRLRKSGANKILVRASSGGAQARQAELCQVRTQWGIHDPLPASRQRFPGSAGHPLAIHARIH